MKTKKGIDTILLKNLYELSLFLLGQFLEVTLRIMRFMTPLGLYTYMLQMKNKATPTTAIHTYLTPKSTFMFIAPGVILVTVTGDEYRNFFKTSKRHWDKNYPALQSALQCIACLCIIIYFTYRLIGG